MDRWASFSKVTVGIILVGGKSSRMGTSKALLEIDGVRLVDRVAEVLRSSGIDRIVVSGEVLGYECVPDLVPNQGPVGGICSSLIYCENLSFNPDLPTESSSEVNQICSNDGFGFKKAIIVPVDMPLISVELVTTLISSLNNAEAVHFKNNPIPLCITIIQRTVDECKRLTSLPEMSVKSFLEHFRALEINVSDGLKKSLTNTNTPEEWKLYYQAN